MDGHLCVGGPSAGQWMEKAPLNYRYISILINTEPMTFMVPREHNDDPKAREFVLDELMGWYSLRKG